MEAISVTEMTLKKVALLREGRSAKVFRLARRKVWQRLCQRLRCMNFQTSPTRLLLQTHDLDLIDYGKELGQGAWLRPSPLACVAQLVEHLLAKQKVVGSRPTTRSNLGV